MAAPFFCLTISSLIRSVPSFCLANNHILSRHWALLLCEYLPGSGFTCDTSLLRWSSLPLNSLDAAMWLREVLSDSGLLQPAHALARTRQRRQRCLGCAKPMPLETFRGLPGNHVDPASKSALEYSRDSQAPRLFMPDSTRAGRWVGCRSLQQALDNLAKRSNAEPVEADWIPVDEVDEERLSLFGGSEVEEPLALRQKEFWL